MKKIILAVILMAAAGGALYYFLQNKKQTITPNDFQKEFVIGKWKIDSLASGNDSAKNNFAILLFAMDSIEKKKTYEFMEDGQVYISLLTDSLAKKDTSAFSWGKNNEFLFKENPSGSFVESLKVVKLDKENFVLQSSDSVLVYLKKI